ncbi:Hypothetical protein Tpal_402 [Trichococcus palustris]|jgi:uncharacterized membrane protein|uniref:DUF2177 family protein n=1 Tax=Trichococcus palustris TaxID=140314 RepID=A0A143Y9T0_9LACT|nr:DUF2177 family protein [Trichococcus palustris]CZQ83130.1 Hypothetical protein Tpal_402 [Trichococcus palustris]SFK69030.1 Uncharacterized membrane protein [Trichococcus palustris]
MESVKIYLLTLAVFFLVDIVWLGVISKNLYKKYLGHLMTPTVNWTAAIIFYLLFIAGLVFFVINPALAKGSLLYAILAGGFFGLIAYGTYDLTNLATLKDWPLLITVIDLVWGTFLNAATAGITYVVAEKFFF